MLFNDKILKYKEIIDRNLENIYPNGPDIIRKPINHILSGGKRFRPILCLLTVDACNGKIEDAIDAAMTIELLHNFTLIHDDIMDEDSLRHGKITIHEKWDESIAILSGDAMLAIAMKKLNFLKMKKIEIIERFHIALIEVCEGQALDLEYQYRDNVTINEYIGMIDKKTGYIIGMCSEIGSMLCNYSVEDQLKLKLYGQLLGRAFQVQDDLLEIISNQDKMGKSLKSDFLLNKKTYLSIKADELDSNYFNKCKDVAKKDYIKGSDLYKKFLINNNLINETKEYVESILNEADKLIKDMDIKHTSLYKYTDMILNRKS